MTRERNFNSSPREANMEFPGALVLTRSPGQDIVILSGKEVLIRVAVESMKPNHGGPVLTVNVTCDQFSREEIQGKVF